MREKLIKAVELLRAREARERAKNMTDEQLEAEIAADLGLQPGIKLTDEQLERIVNYTAEYPLHSAEEKNRNA